MSLCREHQSCVIQIESSALVIDTGPRSRLCEAACLQEHVPREKLSPCLWQELFIHKFLAGWKEERCGEEVRGADWDGTRIVMGHRAHAYLMGLLTFSGQVMYGRCSLQLTRSGVSLVCPQIVQKSRGLGFDNVLSD
ncbi:hypothetical protein RRG08_029034 [Elysia crispata]|uniref:Uncharacterized protein n=1 Tax=Elysia crispata TaxID=231223 RepID=A0AAE1AIF6_9GAST|nr:hypothetical protein RRG08_029034 [Elysia crispata]